MFILYLLRCTKLIMGYGVLCGISYQSLGWSLILCCEGGLQDLVSLVKYKYDQQFPTLGIG